MVEFYYTQVSGVDKQTWEIKQRYGDAGVTLVIGQMHDLQLTEAIIEFLTEREKKYREEVKAKRNQS